jgi:hypothetical protein
MIELARNPAIYEVQTYFPNKFTLIIMLLILLVHTRTWLPLKSTLYFNCIIIST